MVLPPGTAVAVLRSRGEEGEGAMTQNWRRHLPVWRTCRRWQSAVTAQAPEVDSGRLVWETP